MFLPSTDFKHQNVSEMLKKRALTVGALGGTEQLAPVTNRRSTYTDKKTIQKQSKDPPQRSKRSCNNNSNKKKKRFV